MTQEPGGASGPSPSPQSAAPSGPIPREVQYKGAPLDAERGPGLGCFRIQLVVLAIAVVLTPLSVAWSWPSGISAALLFLVILLLFFSGQTVIFLLRLVAAERRATGRRRPLASTTKTVGELEDQRLSSAASESGAQPAGGDAEEVSGPDEQGRMRQ